MAKLCVAHLDADAFYVAVELQRRPELKGKPVVVAGLGPRSVVTTASYEAREFGIGSAMPTIRARRLCPEAIFIQPDFNTYKQISRKVLGIISNHFDRVEVVGLDEVYLDVKELHSPRADLKRLISEIKAETGLNYSVGLGSNRLIAKVASDAEKPNGFVVLSQEQARARFAEMPPKMLPGIGPKTARKLGELGIKTISALANTPVDRLEDRFGSRHGPYLKRRAHFEDSTPVGRRREAKSESRETTFDRDISELSVMEEELGKLASRLCSGLQAHGYQGRTVSIKVRLSNFTTVTRARTLDRAVNDPGTVTAVACSLLRKYAPPKPVRLLGVRVAGFENSQSKQDSQLENSSQQKRQLAIDC